MRVRDRQGCSIMHSPLPFIRSATSFSLSSPLPRHTDYALSLYPRRRGRNHTLSFEHERQGRKTTTRTTDHCMCLSVFACFCANVCFRLYFPLICMYFRCHLDVSECICGGLGFHVWLLHCVLLHIYMHVNMKALI